MPVEVKCPECQALLRIADENLGRKSRCPNCSHVFTASATPVEPPRAPESPFVAPLPEPETPFPPRFGAETSANPYAPTYSQLEPGPETGDIFPRRFTVDEVIVKSWEIFKKHWTMVCVVILIVGAVNFACNMVQNLVAQVLAIAVNEQAIVIGAQLLMTVVFWVLQIWLQLGQTIVMLDIARGRPINISRLFAGTPYLLNGIVAMLLMSLLILGIAGVLIGIPAAIGFIVAWSPEGGGLGAMVGLLIALVPLLVIILALSQWQPLIVDRNVSGLESLRMSYEITKGNRFTLFVLGIALAVIGFIAMGVGLLVFCVGVIPAMIAVGGYGALVFAVAYLCMTGQTVVIPGSNIDPTSSQYSYTLP